MGPLLFNVCLSDLEKLAKYGGPKMLSFPDDFTLYCAKKSPHEAGRALSGTLGNVEDALFFFFFYSSPDSSHTI